MAALLELPARACLGGYRAQQGRANIDRHRVRRGVCVIELDVDTARIMNYPQLGFDQITDFRRAYDEAGDVAPALLDRNVRLLRPIKRRNQVDQTARVAAVEGPHNLGRRDAATIPRPCG